MIGTTQGEHCYRFGHQGTLSIFHTSVRAKVRDEVDGYNASADYWIRCLYEGEQGDPGDVEKGFLKSELLVKARISTHHSLNSLCKLLTSCPLDLQGYIHITIYSGQRPR